MKMKVSIALGVFGVLCLSALVTSVPVLQEPEYHPHLFVDPIISNSLEESDAATDEPSSSEEDETESPSSEEDVTAPPEEEEEGEEEEEEGHHHNSGHAWPYFPINNQGSHNGYIPHTHGSVGLKNPMMGNKENKPNHWSLMSKPGSPPSQYRRQYNILPYPYPPYQPQ